MANTCAHHYLLHFPYCDCILCGERTYGQCMICGDSRTWPRGYQGDLNAAGYRERAMAGRAAYLERARR